MAASGKPDSESGGAAGRFTLDGSAALERQLKSVCDEVTAGVRALVPPAALDGLLLGGGYGRGEGGVLRTDSGDQPYNDLEFYVFVRGNAVLGERKYRAALHELGLRLSPAAGVDVEFKVLTRQKLRTAGPTMFYYDLVVGHRRLLGGDDLLEGCEPHRDPAAIPLSEATRLLLNRCSGLLFSAERLQRPDFGPEEADFVGRNLAKVQLALGDVVLTAAGDYHWSCQVRNRTLSTLPLLAPLPWGEAVRRQHASGVAFKLHPNRSTATRDGLLGRHRELSDLARQVWLWLEQRRLGPVFSTPRDYALNPVNKCPETSAVRNRLVNARAFGLARAIGSRGSEYPRQRLCHALCLLLWDDAPAGDPTQLQRLQRELDTPATDFPGLVAAYERLWHRFN